MPAEVFYVFVAFFVGLSVGAGVGFYIAKISHGMHHGGYTLTAEDIEALEGIRLKLDSLGRKE